MIRLGSALIDDNEARGALTLLAPCARPTAVSYRPGGLTEQ